MQMDYSDPRKSGRMAIRESVPQELWESNERFVQKLIAILAKHPLASHPVKEFLETETLNREKTLLLHLEFGYGFAQVFTDAVLNAMATATQLEERLGPKGKVTARFLWALNLQDELGYKPSDTPEQYSGHPYAAHYFQYVDMFKDLGADEKAISAYKPSPAAVAARATFEEYYRDYTLLTTVLALSESIFDRFAGAWADNVARSSEIDTSRGYHTIHVEDEHGESIDDDHSEDSWTLVRQCLTPDRYDEVEAKVKEWLDVWYRFGDNVLQLAMS